MSENIFNKISEYIRFIFIVFLVIMMLIGGLYYYFFKFTKTELFTQKSPEKQHELEFFEKGSPFFVGESTIQIKYGWKRINVPIANNGAALTENNVSVRWENESSAIITLSGHNMTGVYVYFDAEEGKTFKVKEEPL